MQTTTLETSTETTVDNTSTKEVFVELASKKETLVKELKALNEELEKIMLSLGEGTMFQSKEGLVYKIEVPTGTFVSYKKIDYVRTKREDESKGSLSAKEAEEAGFVLNKTKKTKA